MTTEDEADILNLISDIRSMNAEVTVLKKDVIKLEDELEGIRDDLEQTELTIKNRQVELEELIEKLTAGEDDKSVRSW